MQCNHIKCELFTETYVKMLANSESIIHLLGFIQDTEPAENTGMSKTTTKTQ